MTSRPHDGGRAAFPADFLNEAGLNRQHVFAIAGLPAEMRRQIAAQGDEAQLILLGHAGRRLWEKVTAAGLPGEHPIDDYTRQVVDRWFASFLPQHRYRLLYPGPAPVGLQALGRLAGWHHESPLMLGIDPTWGSWFAYRAVVVANTDFCPFFPVDRSNPCLSCPGAPCIGHCPAQALSRDGMALERCIDFRRQADSPCRESCLARLACPVGAEHRYDTAQLRHTYRLSLQMIEQYATDGRPDGQQDVAQ